MKEILIKYAAYLIFPLISFIISLLLTRCLIHLLPKIGLIDQPGGRHIHKEPTPKGGGIAIIIAFIATWLIFLNSGWNYFTGALDLITFYKLLPAILILFILGYFDDKYDIRARYKLLGQIIAASLCWYFGIGFNSLFTIELPQILSYGLTVFWIISFINAFNLIDGMDGLAAGLAIVSCLSLAAVFAFGHTPLDTTTVLILAGACLGFLRYNFHPAKLFMGDVGSMFIGFMFSVIAISTASKKATFTAISVPVLAMGVPFFDVVLAIWRRYTRKLVQKQDGTHDPTEKSGVMTADKEHLHHRFLEGNDNSQQKTAYRMYLLACLFGVLALFTVILENKARGLAMLLILLAVVTVIRKAAAIEMVHSSKLLLKGLQSGKRSVLIAIHPFLDLLFLTASYLFVYWLLSHTPLKVETDCRWYTCTLYNILPLALILNLSNIYNRSWIHASGKDYARLGNLLIVGHIIATTFSTFAIEIVDNRLFIVERMIYFLLTFVLILGERMLIRYLKNIHHESTIRTTTTSGAIKKVLIYGAGQTGEFYLHRTQAMIEQYPRLIVGILDDSEKLHGQVLYGHKILGGINNLEEVYRKQPFYKLVITSHSIPEEKFQQARTFCVEKGIKFSQYASQETAL